MEEAFIKERAEGLARFLNRIRKIHYFANTEAFYFFLSKHENSFEGAKKEVSKNIKSGDQISPLELVSRYSELFPDAVGREFGFDLEEGILRLKTCWERTDVELKNICKKLQSTINCLSIIGEDANSV